MKKVIQTIALIIGLISIFILTAIVYYGYTLPNSFYLFDYKDFKINSNLSIKADYSTSSDIAFASKTNINSSRINLKLFGIFPIKDVKVNELNKTMLIPGGMPFGIKMFTEGVIVVGINEIETNNGVKNPAKNAGIKIGDIIIEINGEKINSNKDIAFHVSKSEGKKINVKLKRNENIFNIELESALSKVDNLYKCGLWVRDSSAGIGTITFYNPVNGIFGGLGHPISDVDTGKTMPLMSGEVINATINGLIKGYPGIPGELKGNFTSNNPIGNILSNDDTGVYGVLYNFNSDKEPIPIAVRQEIKYGKAKILTTINGSEPEEYEVKIEKINLNDDDSLKNMVIKVTDDNLLSKTGGIVQGMSGSPIIQDGKLIGAITHVFVNDPTKGYGIFLENMYDTSTSIDLNRNKLAS